MLKCTFIRISNIKPDFDKCISGLQISCKGQSRAVLAKEQQKELQVVVVASCCVSVFRTTIVWTEKLHGIVQTLRCARLCFTVPQPECLHQK